MHIIEKVIISKFRSFGKKEELICGDLNIFSGGNDTGKSNVLKALNLFFNERTNLYDRYNFEHDYNKWFRDNNERGERNIEIEIHFEKGSYWDPNNSSHTGINEQGFIAKKIFGAKGDISINLFYKNGTSLDELSKKRALAVIQEKIKFIYIPAVRDNDFRKSIQKELREVVTNTTSNMENVFNSLNASINDTFKDLQKSLLSLHFFADVNFQAILESLSFSTNEQIEIKKRGRGGKKEKQNILISNRGDGIQMQFFSFLLWFIASKDKSHSYIWGFEEPEVAYEYKRQVEIADIFQKQFSINTQIFITSHSPAFIFLDKTDKCGIKKYRVFLKEDTVKNRKISKINDLQSQDLFEDEEEDLTRDIWGVKLQRLFHSLGNLINKSDDMNLASLKIQELEEEVKQKQLIENKNGKLKQDLESLKPPKVFICEDENGKTIWKHLFNEFGINGIEIIPSKGCTNDDVEKYLLGIKKNIQNYNPIIFRQIDLDGFTKEQVAFLEQVKSEKYNKKITKYQVKFLPVNEIENFVLLLHNEISNENLLENGVYDKLVDAFSGTADNNLENIRKNFITKKTPEETQNLFNKSVPLMREEAKKDTKKFFNGKEICKIKRINFESELKALKRVSFPEELINYLTIINEHFNNGTN